jgi:hypothetical protein
MPIDNKYLAASDTSALVDLRSLASIICPEGTLFRLPGDDNIATSLFSNTEVENVTSDSNGNTAVIF